MSSDGIFVIFGATGDLAKRKLLPALYRLAKAGFIAENFRILGTTRRDTTVEDAMSEIRKNIQAEGETVDEQTMQRVKSMFSIVKMDISQVEDYSILKAAADKAVQEIGKQVNLLYYLAVPPEMFGVIVEGLGAHDLHTTVQNSTESRLLIEKPFGYDTSSALELIKQMEKVFPEEGIYRVDHYLAKETAQNILTFRLQNPLFRSVWNNTAVSHIMITASESIGIEGRANFYEKTGALRDLIQSHLLQLLALVTMEEPAERTSEAIHDCKLALLECVKQIHPEEVQSSTVRGQYEGYAEEVGNPQSTAETYAAIKLEVDNDRWRGVPMLLRTGKGMAEKVTEITLIFKSRDYASTDANALTIRIQPNEGIVLSLLAKEPSFEEKTQKVQMEFFYDDTFAGKHAGAYERVLIDAIRGDKTLFTTDKEVMASWKIVENVISEWASDKTKPASYSKGSWGPAQADDLAASSDSKWLTGHLKTKN